MNTISLSQLRTQTKKLQALLANRQTITLLKGSQVIGQITPTSPVSFKNDSTPLFIRGIDLGGDFKKTLVERKDFYE